MLSTLRRSLLPGRAPRRAFFSGLSRSSPSALATRSFSSSQPEVEQHTFKAETRRLLDIVAKSLYTDKEVFVRELISNASDALEKLRFLQTTQRAATAVQSSELKITISVDEAARTFTIEDSGQGMSKEELIANLGTIARSGTREFSASNDSKLIGRFGVGFYSTFVVADRVEVVSRAASDARAPVHRWTSDGHGEFSLETLAEAEVASEAEAASQSVFRGQSGTRITLHLKPECDDFAKFEAVKAIVNKFSSFVDFPIYLAATHSASAGHTAAGQTQTAAAAAAPARVNAQEALWLKTAATAEEHTAFFQHLTGSSYAEPLYALLYHTDAPLSIKAALYVTSEAPAAPGEAAGEAPGEAPGVALYANRVLVQKASGTAVLPVWMRGWVRGVVDCEDSISLNVSREHMQDSQALKKLSHALVRKLLRFLVDEAAKDKTKFCSSFFPKFGAFLKNGLLEDARTNNAAHKDLIAKLLRFPVLRASVQDASDLVSLDECVEAMDAANAAADAPILYVVAPDVKTARNSPYLEHGPQVATLVFTQEIDEYLANFLGTFRGRRLLNVASSEATGKTTSTSSSGLEDERRRSLAETFMKQTLGDELVDKVVFSEKLKNSPALVTSQISPNMRRMMKQMIRDSGSGVGVGVGAPDSLLDGIPVTLELNANHPVVLRILALAAKSETEADAQAKQLAELATKQLFTNALIAAGLVENPQLILDTLNAVLNRLVAQ